VIDSLGMHSPGLRESLSTLDYAKLRDFFEYIWDNEKLFDVTKNSLQKSRVTVHLSLDSNRIHIVLCAEFGSFHT